MAKLNSELVKKIAGLMRGACGPVSAEAVARMVGRDPSDRVFRLHLHAARDSLLSGGEADFGPTGKGDGRYEIKTPEQMTQRAKRYKRAAAAKVDRAQRMAAMAAEQSDDNTARRRAENQQDTLAALRALMGGLWCLGQRDGPAHGTAGLGPARQTAARHRTEAERREGDTWQS